MARERRALCLACNYPLEGLNDPRCPECGQAFDRADGRTMNFGHPTGRAARWVMRGGGWLNVLVLAACVAAMAWRTGWPGAVGGTGWAEPYIPELAEAGRTTRDLATWAKSAGARDWLRVTGAAGFTLSATLWLLRTLAWPVVILAHRQPLRRGLRDGGG